MIMLADKRVRMDAAAGTVASADGFSAKRPVSEGVMRLDPNRAGWAGGRIRRLRLALRMTGKEFAGEFCTSFTRVSFWENNWDAPDRERVAKMERMEQKLISRGKLEEWTWTGISPEVFPNKPWRPIEGAAKGEKYDGRWIFELMKMAGFESEKEFAESIGISHKALNNWIKGIREPQLDSLKRIVRFANKSSLLHLVPYPEIARSGLF